MIKPLISGLIVITFSGAAYAVSAPATHFAVPRDEALIFAQAQATSKSKAKPRRRAPRPSAPSSGGASSGGSGFDPKKIWEGD